MTCVPLPLWRQPCWHCLTQPPGLAPPVGNVTGGDVHRGDPGNTRIHHQTRHWLGAGVGRGLARRSVRLSGSRGQKLVQNAHWTRPAREGQTLATKLEGTSAGRGQSIPSPPVGRPEQRGRQADAHTEASLPPPITMHLDHQGPPVTYSKATSRSPQRTVVSSSELPVYDVWLKIAAHKKEKEAAWVHPWLDLETGMRQRGHSEENWRSASSTESGDVMLGIGWRRKELGGRKNIIMSKGPSGACPDPITDPLGWCKYEWSKKERN